MIHYLFGHYLSQYNHKSVPITFNSNRKLGMVIIATKISYWLPLVIKNAADKIKDANIYFVGTQQCIKFLKSKFGSSIQYRVIGDFNKIESNNWLLLNRVFWELFNEEYLLIFQPDCLLINTINNDFYKYDYIGAVCGNVSNDSTFTINGGLSLRRRLAMIDVCKGLNEKENSGNINEDIIFTQKMRAQPYKYNLPSMHVCNQFAIESYGNIDTCVGIHGTDKYYIDPTILSKFSTLV